MTPFISSRVRKLDVGIPGYTDTSSVVDVTGKVSIGTKIDIAPYDNINNGTLRLEGSAGTLFSISNNLTTGSIFSVNDVTGVPSLDVNADGTILLAPFGQTEYIGIGKTNPTQKVDIDGSIKLSGNLLFENINVISYSAADVGVDTISFEGSEGQLFSVTNNLSTGSLFSVNNVAGLPYINVDADGTIIAGINAAVGNFGIGTETPTEKLEVVGSIKASDGLILSDTGPYNTVIQYVTPTNNRNISFPDATGTIALVAGTTGQIQYNDNGKLAASPNFVIDSNSNVGIGTSSPSEKLVVVGNIIIGNRTNITPSTAGSAYLKFDGTGYDGYITLDATALYFGHNSDGRDIRFQTASGSSLVDRITIKAAGNVGIGTTAPAVKIHIEESLTSGTDQAIQRITTAQGGSFNIRCSDLSSAAPDWEFFTGNSEDIVFSPSSSEKARITSDGGLLVGTISSRTNFYNGAPTFQVEGISTAASQISVTNNTPNQNPPTFTLGKTRNNGTTAGYTAVIADDILGRIHFAGADGTNMIRGAEILAQVDGNPGANDMPSCLVFSTTADGSAIPTERMRIDSIGRVGIGTESPNTQLEVVGSTPNIRIKPAANTETAYHSFANTSNSTRGYLAYDFNTESLFLGVNAAERLRITSDGEVGIGTDDPAHILHVKSPTNYQGIFINGSDAPSISFDIGALTVTRWKIGISGNNSTNFSISAGDSNDDRFVIDSSGNAFIGTLTSPLVNTNNSKLVVDGTISETVSGIQYPVVSQFDIGTDPNQIPLNQFLGDMAFADFPFAQVANNSNGAAATVVVNAQTTDLYSHIASYSTNVTYQISNLESGHEIKMYLRNTNASARTITIQASTTNSGYANVNLAPGAGTMGAASVSTVTLAATSGTTMIYVANIGGDIVGGILA